MGTTVSRREERCVHNGEQEGGEVGAQRRAEKERMCTTRSRKEENVHNGEN